jgi:hypothetical protein
LAACRADHGASAGTERASHSRRKSAEVALAEAGRRNKRNPAAVSIEASAMLEDVPSSVVGGERLEAKVRDQSERPVLAGPDPLAAKLDDLAGAEGVVERAPTHSITRLEHDHGGPVTVQFPRRDEPSQAGADHRDVDCALTTH